MVAKISVGSSLYGAIAYNGEKINEAQGRLLTTNRIYNDGSGTVDIGKAMEGFLTFMPPQMNSDLVNNFAKFFTRGKLAA